MVNVLRRWLLLTTRETGQRRGPLPVGAEIPAAVFRGRRPAIPQRVALDYACCALRCSAQHRSRLGSLQAMYPWGGRWA
jgi:hypothetical protein